ncbi:3-deoxy-7-phosphoheptulonate synthase [Thermoplasmatales archaeon AK]|nr:3-deoxy-7-phosphoheptulonate synthase [Thermoplasmatales archaeon AK]
MIVVTDDKGISKIKESLSSSSASFKRISLYGKTVFLTWGDEIKAPQNAISVKGDGAPVLSTRSWKSDNTVVEVGGVPIGSNDVVIAAGPCAVESEEQFREVARGVARNGSAILRGGAFKPRTSPYSFQGLGVEGIRIMHDVSEELGVPIVTEIMDAETLRECRDMIDMVQIGSRNAQNFTLLQKVGRSGKPVLLKNGMGNTVNEWLNSSEYLLSEGNENVVLCYRGVKSFENSVRFSFDAGSLTRVKHLSHLPLAADPSHPAGDSDLVESIALAAVAAGADMLEIEVHPDPPSAKSDSAQQLTLEQFRITSERIQRLASALGRGVWKP